MVAAALGSAGSRVTVYFVATTNRSRSALEELAEDLLAGAAAVVDGGVDDVAARLGVGVEHASALLDRRADAALLAERHRAEDQLGHPQAARTEEAVSHARTLSDRQPSRSTASASWSTLSSDGNGNVSLVSRSVLRFERMVGQPSRTPSQHLAVRLEAVVGRR